MVIDIAGQFRKIEGNSVFSHDKETQKQGNENVSDMGAASNMEIFRAPQPGKMKR